MSLLQTKALEESIRKHRDQLTKVHSEFRQRWANATSEKKTMEAEKQALETTVSDLRNQIQVLTADLDGRLNTLRSEKAAVEKSLEIERAAKGSDQSSSQDAIVVSHKHTCCLLLTYYAQVALREERDKLLTEKESWVSSSVSSNTDVDEARRQWAAEKAELIKARDHAASQVKV